MSKETKFILLQASVVFNQQIGLFDAYEDTKEGRNKAFRDILLGNSKIRKSLR